jgi:hypothetical protein
MPRGAGEVMPVLSNQQADEAESIRTLLGEVDALEAAATDRVLEAGRRLVEAKETCAHGTWLPFLARAGIHQRRAQRLMALAKSGLKNDTVTHLGGQRGALRFLELREKSVSAFAAIAAAEPDFSADPVDVLEDICRQMSLAENAVAIIDEMYGMFPGEAREAAEAQRAADVDEAFGWGMQLQERAELYAFELFGDPSPRVASILRGYAFRNNSPRVWLLAEKLDAAAA